MSQSVLAVRHESEIYQCVRCNSGLQEHEPTGLACATCGLFYPTIEGVKVLVSDPDQLLGKHAEWLTERRKELETRKANATNAFDEDLHDRESLALVEQSYDGLLANLNVVEKQMEPVKQYLAARNQPPSLFSELEGIGWPATEMVEYFYRDWSGSSDAQALEALFTDAVERFCSEKESVAVLGAGGCGLLQKLRRSFPQTYGVDLAVDTLLLSKRLLDGERLTLHLTAPHLTFPVSNHTVTLEGAHQKRTGICLLAANVNQLPFGPASLSCVITQYMMDIVPSQGRLAAEINRVLVEGGVWIDFSLPLAMSAEDQFNSLNLSTFLEQSGFDLLDRKMHRVDVLDLSSLTEWAWSSRQTPIMFVAKKVSEPATPRYNYFAEYFAKKGEAIWDKVPKRVVDIALTNERRFTNSGVQESKGLTVLRPNNPRAGSFKVSHQTAAMTEWLVDAVDGTRTLREISDLMRKDFGPNIPPDQVLQFFSGLEESHLIEIH